MVLFVRLYVGAHGGSSRLGIWGGSDEGAVRLSDVAKSNTTTVGTIICPQYSNG